MAVSIKGYEIALTQGLVIKMGVVDATAEEQELELVGKAADGVGSKRVSVKRKSEAIEEDLNGKSSLRGGGYHMRKRTSGIARDKQSIIRLTTRPVVPLLNCIFPQNSF